MIEIIYVIGLVQDPCIFCSIIVHWCKSKVLPPGNLAVVLIDEAYTKYGGLINPHHPYP
jgi:hypothetical protein